MREDPPGSGRRSVLPATGTEQIIRGVTSLSDKIAIVLWVRYRNSIASASKYLNFLHVGRHDHSTTHFTTTKNFHEEVL